MRGVYLTFGGGVINIPPWSDFENLARFSKSDPYVHLGGTLCISRVKQCAACFIHHTPIVTQHTPADTFQITMPGTPTSPPPRRFPRSKTKAHSRTTTTSDDSESDADERTPRTPPRRRSPRSKKSARSSENSESDADEQTPTSPRPPRRAPRGKKKARLLVILVTTVYWTLLTDQGRRRRPTTRDSMQRRQQQVERNLQTTQKMKTT